MKVRVSHGAVAVREPAVQLMAEDMTPRRLHLYIGQMVDVLLKDENGNYKRKGTIEIRKLYKHHALCKVNGRWNESFTYNELSTMAAVRECLR